MADEPVPGLIGPAATPASIFTMSVTPQEILLTFGTQRVVFGPDGDPLGAITKDWSATYTLSATAAKMLASALAETMVHYEKAFGPVPMDPNFELQTLAAEGDVKE